MPTLSIHDSEFAREFAAFVDFMGGDELHRAIRKVVLKLAQLDRATRRVFGTRYFFQEGIEELTSGATPFRLDTSDVLSVRTASFIAGANRARADMSATAAVRFRKMIFDNLKPDRDFRQIEHEVRCYIHLRQKLADVKFADLEEIGNFDLICRKTLEVEVECKTVSEDTGNPIKNETTVILAQLFLRLVRNPNRNIKPGIFSIRFKSEPRASNEISKGLELAVEAATNCPLESKDGRITFLPRPLWEDLTQPPNVEDPDIGNRAHCITVVGGRAFALVLESDRAGSLSHRVIRVLKDAADQLSATRPSMIWLHFVGLAEKEFRDIAQFSMNGKGGGLNALVANALFSPAGSDRSHVNLVRFSAEPAGITRRPALDSQLMLSRAASLDAIAYEVPNPLGRFVSSKFDL